MPNTSPIEALARTLSRIQGYEDLGLHDEALRELGMLPPAVRALPTIELRQAQLLERLGRFAEALNIFARTERCTVAELGRVRCLARLQKSAEARRLMAAILFEPGFVKEFVETRDLLE